MTIEEFMQKVASEISPQALVTTDPDGLLVILTNLVQNPDGTVEPSKDPNLSGF